MFPKRQWQMVLAGFCPLLHISAPVSSPPIHIICPVFSPITHSCTIVGYTTSTIETTGQQKFDGGQFVSVGEEALNIQDIKVNGNPPDGSVWIKWWNSSTKSWSDKALYFSELYELSGDPIVPKTAGWGDGEFWAPVSKTFAPGQGFCWGVDSDNLGITLSGEVIQPATEYVGRSLDDTGKQEMVVNPFPMELNIQNIKVDGVPPDGSVWIKWWDTTNKVWSEKALFFNELYELSGDPIVPKTSGWGDGEFWAPINHTFLVGEGFCWGIDDDNHTIKIPNPFYKGE